MTVRALTEHWEGGWTLLIYISGPPPPVCFSSTCPILQASTSASPSTLFNISSRPAFEVPLHSFPNPQGCGAAFNWLLSQGRLPLPHPPDKVRECEGNGHQHKVEGHKHQPDVNLATALDNPKSSIINQLPHSPTKRLPRRPSPHLEKTHTRTHTHTNPWISPPPFQGGSGCPSCLDLLGFCLRPDSESIWQVLLSNPPSPPTTGLSKCTVFSIWLSFSSLSHGARFT